MRILRSTAIRIKRKMKIPAKIKTDSLSKYDSLFYSFLSSSSMLRISINPSLMLYVGMNSKSANDLSAFKKLSVLFGKEINQNRIKIKNCSKVIMFHMNLKPTARIKLIEMLAIVIPTIADNIYCSASFKLFAYSSVICRGISI